MKNCHVLIALCGLVGLMTTTGPAEARPQYLKRFTETYPKVETEAKELKCGVCHGDGGKDKKSVSDYGKSLSEALKKAAKDPEAKNIKDEAQIDEALKAVEAEGDVDGKKYGELLSEGKLPPVAPAAAK